MQCELSCSFWLLFHLSPHLSADDLQADCQSVTAKVFRCQKILEGKSYHIMATAVGRSPSVLGTMEAEKAGRVAQLSGAAWPDENAKVLSLYLFVLLSKLFIKWCIAHDMCKQSMQMGKRFVKKCFFLQKVEVGLQLKALNLLCDATRKADEELQSYTQECVESSSIIETYMTLANFCDKLLRGAEQSDTGL